MAEEPSPAEPPTAPRPFVGLRDLRPREPDREGLAQIAARELDAVMAAEGEPPPPMPPEPGGEATPTGGSRPEGTAPSPPSDDGP